MLKATLYAGVIVVAALGAKASALAEDAKQKDVLIEQTKRFWNPQALMQGACTNISAHYNLDNKQKESTCKLLTERVTKFLDKHDTKLWPLLMELTELQMAGESPNVETAKQLHAKGYEIFLDARKEIMLGQDEFRKILSAEQKEIHDRDLKGLRRTMDVIDRRFGAWREGKTTGRAPLEGVRLAGGEKIMPQPRSSTYRNKVLHESKWDKYVRDFIRDYRLDEGQKKTALTILKDLKEQVIQYRKTHRQELREADQFLREAKAARPPDPAAVKIAQNMKDWLNRQFVEAFNELKDRLERIPTEKQKEEYYRRFPHLRPKKAFTRGDDAKSTKPQTPASHPTQDSEKPGKTDDKPTPPKEHDDAKVNSPPPQSDKKKS